MRASVRYSPSGTRMFQVLYSMRSSGSPMACSTCASGFAALPAQSAAARRCHPERALAVAIFVRHHVQCPLCMLAIQHSAAGICSARASRAVSCAVPTCGGHVRVQTGPRLKVVALLDPAVRGAAWNVVALHHEHLHHA